MSDGAASTTATACPQCGATIDVADDFCEACGTQLRDSAQAAPPVEAGAVGGQPCTVCGGRIDDDGFCQSCGARAPSPRDHWSETPAADLAAVCDRGILHARNEDAMAMGVSADGSVSVMVVCDGVTTAPDSDRASLAAANVARDLLLDAVDPAPQSGAGAIDHWSTAITAATEEANRAAVAVARSLGDPPEPPSCTFVAAVATGSVAVVGWCGDSRAYWLPDEGEARQIGLDHSLGTEMIRSGMSRAEAERDPTCHTITRWLGADSPTPVSEIESFDVTADGWLLVCSDGLWNYLSDADALRTTIASHATAGATPLAIADQLVAFANERGGHDNITVALLRRPPADLVADRDESGHAGLPDANDRRPPKEP